MIFSFIKLTLARSLGKHWKPSDFPSVFNTSLEAMQIMFMNGKACLIFVMDNAENAAKHNKSLN